MLKKDLLELCLLHLLTDGDRYGYELLRRLHDAFPDTQESAVYALLRGLCREGSTSQYQAASPDGPARKYYKLTGQGRSCGPWKERNWVESHLIAVTDHPQRAVLSDLYSGKGSRQTVSLASIKKYLSCRGGIVSYERAVE